MITHIMGDDGAFTHDPGVGDADELDPVDLELADLDLGDLDLGGADLPDIGAATRSEAAPLLDNPRWQPSLVDHDWGESEVGRPDEIAP
jgi:hypothetical protein